MVTVVAPLRGQSQKAPHLSVRVACAAATAQSFTEEPFTEESFTREPFTGEPFPEESFTRESLIGESFVAYQYATYPFRLSGNLRIDPTDPHRVYAYVMNAGPGILSGDDLQWQVDVGDRASLYLTDQSATKVHSQPIDSANAHMTYHFSVGSGAYLEYVPEPMILFSAANLTQRMNITLHPQGTLVLSEIIVPGRLARGEYYKFEQFLSRMTVRSSSMRSSLMRSSLGRAVPTPEGSLLFADALKLSGRSNQFRSHGFLTDYPILGSFIIISPELDREQLSEAIEAIDGVGGTLQLGTSPLPNCNGLFVRAMATQTNVIKDFQYQVLSLTRQMLNQPPLPAIPK
ncbi:MAG: urease accessory protein UreD [Cyanobacteria bacterium J06598_3]